VTIILTCVFLCADSHRQIVAIVLSCNVLRTSEINTFSLGHPVYLIAFKMFSLVRLEEYLFIYFFFVQNLCFLCGTLPQWQLTKMSHNR
jgi:hypothetical protein